MTWVLWIAAAAIGYVSVGCSVWLWLRSRSSPRPVRRGVVEPAVSGVLAVRNEEGVVARKLQNLLALEYGKAGIAGRLGQIERRDCGDPRGICSQSASAHPGESCI